ncbi:hypothetical protein XBP1_930033 [Xenorhabdus bovienii str. puntauvense]|uniref:Uncharacterized protein n=1 Tax=Xenorhabdus bovienii str. puntauvense TaxID=1398201 RepID=A0A077NLD6_XENBV|nr:hypothetical protein XBP1_930033 [Xenorhabdus bovienii str. puntauvense]
MIASKVPLSVTLVETIRLGGCVNVRGPFTVSKVRGQPAMLVVSPED